jgi:parallel beta-helix repeat protein
MTVLTATTKAGPYAGAGTTGPFSVPFRFLENAHLRVIKTSTAGVDADLVLTSDYTVSGAGAASGSVTLTAPLAVGEKLTVIRNVPATQEADYVPGDAFPAESHEVALDKLTMLVQQQGEEIGRSLRMAPSVAGASTVLPTPQSNRVIGWNEAATGLQNLSPSDFATIVAFGTAQADQFVGNGTTTDFPLSFFPGALANLDVSVDGATYVPGVDYTWASGQTLTFTVAPLAGQEILARYMRALPQGTADAAAVSYVPAGTGAVATNVQSKLREFVSALDKGAAGNGVADDTAELQALFTNHEYVNLVGPDKVYLISSTLTVPSNRTILGNGATIRRMTGSGVFDLIQNLDQVGGNTNIAIRNLVVDGNKDADSLVATDPADRFSGISLKLVTGKSEVVGCKVIGTVNNETGGGIYVDTCQDVLVENNEVTGNDRTGVVLFNSLRCTIRGNTCYDNDGSGITGGGNTDCHYTDNKTFNNGTIGIGYTGLNGTGVRSIITGNTSFGNTGSGITVGDGAYDGSYSVVSNNVCYDNTLDGITVSGTPTTDVRVTGNLAHSNTRRGIWVGTAATDCVITSNTVTENDTIGIFLDTGNNHIVANNKVFNNGQSGIYIDPMDNVSVLGNECFNNGRITTANSAGILMLTVTKAVVSDNICYDDQGGSATQESSIWLAGGSANLVSGNIVYPTKTNLIRETSSPSYEPRANKYGSDKLRDTFTATAASTTTVVNNNNSRDRFRIKVWPTNAAAAARVPFVSSVVVGTSFTVTFASNSAGTETYAYEIE